jgi:hypothetical protein
MHTDELLFAVPVPRARELLGDMCRSNLYKAAGRGLLDFVKAGDKTLVTIESIRRYQRSWPRATIKAPSR